MDQNKVTRIEVIEQGVTRHYVNNSTKLVRLEYQDDGRTLKIFIDNSQLGDKDNGNN